MSKTIGITGGIGSGKSEVSKYLTSIDEKVICADKVAYQIVLPGEPGNNAVRNVFGDSFFHQDGTLNREKLAQVIFRDKEKRKKLNDILHPIIINNMFDQAKKANGRVFLDTALLIQTGMYKQVDYVWLVVADVETRIKRVMQRDGLAYDEVKYRIGAQLSDKNMLPYTHEVINNNRDIENLHQQVIKLLNKPPYS